MSGGINCQGDPGSQSDRQGGPNGQNSGHGGPSGKPWYSTKLPKRWRERRSIQSRRSTLSH